MKTSLPTFLLLAGFGLSAAQGAASTHTALSDTLATVDGTVSDEQGNPIAGVRVHAIAKIFKDAPFREYLVDDSTQTADDGSYAFTALETITNAVPGTEYYLTFGKKGFRPPGTALPPIQPGTTTRLDVSLQRILSLSFRITEKGAALHPLAGAKITLSPQGPGTPYLYGISGQNGDFEFPDLYAGSKNITVAMAGYASQVIRKSLDASVWADSLEVQLQKQGIDSSRTLTGRLKSDRGRTTFQDTVVFSCAQPGGDMNLFSVSDVTGAFSIRGIPAGCASGFLSSGSGSMQIALQGANTDAELRVDRAFPAVLEVGPGARARASLGKGPILSGTYFPAGKNASFNALGRENAPKMKGKKEAVR